MNRPYAHNLLVSFTMLFGSFLIFQGCSKSGNAPSDKIKTNPILLAIDSLSANEGDYNAQIIISGSGFSNVIADDHVFFNGQEATISAATTTRLTVTIPKDAGTGNVTVKVNSLTATGPIFTYLGVLAINSINTNSGPYNTTVTITGTGFSAAIANNKVFFNGIPAVITRATATQLIVTVPLGAGTGKITLAVNAGIVVNGPIFTYQLSAVLTVFAGSGKAGFENGKGVAASFNTPTGIAADKAGNLYVADEQNNAIRKITPDGTVSTLAGNGAIGDSNGTGALASFNRPSGVAVDKNGNVYVTDSGNDIIRQVTSEGITSTFAGSVGGYTDGSGALAKFANPLGIALDGSGNVFITDQINNAIRKITSDGFVSTVVRNSMSRFQPGIAVDNTNNLYVTDELNNVVQKITPSATITNLENSDMSTTFNRPSGVSIDLSGNIYLAASNQIIKIANGKASTLLNLEVRPAKSLTIQAIIPHTTVLSLLPGIAVDGVGNIYIADPSANLIKKISMQ